MRSTKNSGPGLVILAIDDEEVTKIKPFPDRAAGDISGPSGSGAQSQRSLSHRRHSKSFVYDREGKLVAQSIDMRTQKQFLEMLAQAGLR